MSTSKPLNRKAWLKRHGISNYQINAKGEIDVEGNVDLHELGLVGTLPYAFGRVSGEFRCDSNQLTSLQNCPHTVGGTFSCFNNALTSLRFCPQIVGGGFYCGKNKLETLEFCPELINRDFECSNNLLTNLRHGPKIVEGNFNCNLNALTSLKDCPIEVGGEFWCCYNKLSSMEYCPSRVGGGFFCYENPGLAEIQYRREFREILPIHLEINKIKQEKENLSQCVDRPFLSSKVHKL